MTCCNYHMPSTASSERLPNAHEPAQWLDSESIRSIALQHLQQVRWGQRMGTGRQTPRPWNTTLTQPAKSFVAMPSMRDAASLLYHRNMAGKSSSLSGGCMSSLAGPVPRTQYTFSLQHHRHQRLLTTMPTQHTQTPTPDTHTQTDTETTSTTPPLLPPPPPKQHLSQLLGTWLAVCTVCRKAQQHGHVLHGTAASSRLEDCSLGAGLNWHVWAAHGPAGTARRD